MLRTISYQLLNLSSFLLFFLFFLIFLAVILHYIVKQFDFKTDKMKFYGILLGLNDKAIIMISTVTCRFLFLLWCIFYCKTIGQLEAIVLGGFTILYLFHQFRLRHICFELLNFIVQYAALMSCSILLNYMLDVGVEYSMLLILLLIIMFFIVYVCYYYVRAIHDIVIKNKYVRKERL